MHIQNMDTDTLIEDGVKQLNVFFDNGQWADTLALGQVVADKSRDRHDRATACFRVIENIEQVRGWATGPDDNMEAHLLAEHFREIRLRLYRM